MYWVVRIITFPIGHLCQISTLSASSTLSRWLKFSLVCPSFKADLILPDTTVNCFSATPPKFYISSGPETCLFHLAGFTILGHGSRGKLNNNTLIDYFGEKEVLLSLLIKYFFQLLFSRRSPLVLK